MANRILRASLWYFAVRAILRYAKIRRNEFANLLPTPDATLMCQMPDAFGRWTRWREEPALEAVTIDPAHEKISVATLGRIRRARWKNSRRASTDKIQSARNADAGHACSLLDGKSDCAICGLPIIRNRTQADHHQT